MAIYVSMDNKLTTKQRKFVELYSGNATEAAIKAGYSKKTAFTIGCENLKKPYILQAIRERETKTINKAIMTRQERQAFWSEVANNPNVEWNNRLKASELLGKSEADFTEVQQHKFIDYNSLNDNEKTQILKQAIEVLNG